MMSSIPQDLINACNSKNLIPVIGAGVSMSLRTPSGTRPFPSWKELLEKAATKIATQSLPDIAEGIHAMIKLQRYHTAAELAREGLGGRLWSSFFHENFSVRKEQISSQSLDLPRAVWVLGNRLMTLNYDKVLRFSANEPESVVELDNSSITQLADFSRSETEFETIWHLHGKIDNPDHIIFTEESYTSLYSGGSKYAAALEILRTTCRDKTLLFVGCSLDDAELLHEIASTHTMFSMNTGPHYALVKEEHRATIQEKLKELPINLITFKDYGNDLLELIYAIAGKRPAHNIVPTRGSDTRKISATIAEASKNPRIAVLTAEPIDKDFQYGEYLKEIKRLKCEIDNFYLTLYNLQQLGQYDYVVILTKATKGKIVIEEETLESRRINLSELEENLGTTPSKALLIFLDHTSATDLNADDLALMSIPTLIYPRLTKAALEIFNFKTFKKSEFSFIPDIIKKNMDGVEFEEMKGTYKNIPKRTRLPDEIDAKVAQNFVGRKTDLSNIARKIIELRHKGEILTIKGSGGVGKTQTTKRVVISLAERGFFHDGIFFIDCEFISDHKIFERSVAQPFNLQDAADFKEQLKNDNSTKDILIILDNVETLLHLSDTPAVKSFISFICDYATCVVTSREVLSLDCEDVYELRQLTSEEGKTLFFQEFGDIGIDDQSKEFVRTEIIEALLDNNPLAIKLISKNTPKSKAFDDLKSELEDDIFRVTDSDIESFGTASDSNIERKRSLFASINYSYNALSAKEKATFEVLSLFPDGINLENLKKLSEFALKPEKRLFNGLSSSNEPITDITIRALENKSMIQIDNRMVKLQSIVGKFASAQFLSRPQEEIKRYQRSALEFCYAYANYLANLLREDPYSARKITSVQQANFIKSVEYAEAADIGSKEFLEYLERVNALFTSICIGGVLLRAQLRRSDAVFPDESSRLCFNLLCITLDYYDGNFDIAYAEFKKLIEVDKLLTLDPKNEVERIIARLMENIFGMEGESLTAARSEVRRQGFTGFYPQSLVQLGLFDERLIRFCRLDFFTLEARLGLGILNIEMTKEYIESIYEKGHLEIMQSYYVLAKLQALDKETIGKLVVVNPYTEGLKHLMLALNESESEIKIEHFNKACELLFHIKYYYVEALFLFARHLQATNDQNFEEIYSLALDLANKHNYRFLLHSLRRLKNTEPEFYDELSYPFKNEKELRDHIEFILKNIRNSRYADVKPKSYLGLKRA
jgi:hypothetical protein